MSTDERPADRIGGGRAAACGAPDGSTRSDSAEPQRRKPAARLRLFALTRRPLRATNCPETIGPERADSASGILVLVRVIDCGVPSRWSAVVVRPHPSRYDSCHAGVAQLAERQPSKPLGPSAVLSRLATRAKRAQLCALGVATHAPLNRVRFCRGSWAGATTEPTPRGGAGAAAAAVGLPTARQVG